MKPRRSNGAKISLILLTLLTVTTGCFHPRLNNVTRLIRSDKHPECDLCREWKRDALITITDLEYEIERK